MSAHVVNRIIDPAHPSLPGHFPGQPVVPGVVMLDEVIAAISEWRGQVFVPAAFPSVKFLVPLLPGEKFTIRLQEQDGRIDFECMRETQVLLRGVVR